MDDQKTNPASALLRHKLFDGLRRAERALFTRPAPKSPRAQMKFLHTRAKGSTTAVAEQLGVSRSTVARYLSGAVKRPQKRLQAALVEETESQWQPQVRAQARQRAATSGGLVISCRAYFGFGPEGSSDAGRMRDVMTAVSPTHADRILTAREHGATDDDLHEMVAEAIADAYFRKEGGGRAGLHVEFKDVERLDISF
ncbi:terminal protein [Streptomyces sp. ND04-05B]|uniref:telomere-protecting terminal protein Tpg n=1 Tax=Streptomyces sp. ND04-05B TaxID=3028693 RepID=UPI0029ABF550|nr:terminal protein [Streptomyces sp. ND04-05B]MDX3069974.1 terminal protein [Streptomyces sp. ND04-05B]